MANNVTVSDLLKAAADQETTDTEVYVRMHNSDPIPVTDIKQEEMEDGKTAIILELS